MTSRGTSPSPASLSSSPGRIEAQRAENGPSITAPSCGSSLTSTETSILIFHWGGHWKDTNCWWHFLSHHPPHSPGAPLKSRQAIPKSSQKHPEFNGRQLGDQIHCKVANAMTCLNSSHWSRKASKRRIHDMLMVSSGRCVRSGSSEAQLADVSRGPTAPTQLDWLSSCMPRTPAMSRSKVPNITFANPKNVQLTQRMGEHEMLLSSQMHLFQQLHRKWKTCCQTINVHILLSLDIPERACKLWYYRLLPFFLSIQIFQRDFQLFISDLKSCELFCVN